MKDRIAYAAVVAIALVALVGVLGIVSITSFGITGAASVDNSFSGLTSDSLLSAVVVLLGIGLGYLYLKKSKYI